MLTLCLRREPTTDSLRHSVPELKGKMDVQAYRDPQATQPAGRWPWHYSSRPCKGCKTVMLNCYRWQAVWLEDLKEN